MPKDQASEPSRHSFLAEVEEEIMQLLNREQCEAIALWMKVYGDAFGAASTTCGRTVRTNFRYAANRLEVMGKGLDSDT